MKQETKEKGLIMKHRIIYQKDNFRIIELLDKYYDMENLKGDSYNPKYITEIDVAELKRQEIKFENEVYNNGVYGYELQAWNSEIDQGWTFIDSCWGFVGSYDSKSEKYNHYIIDELKSQIKQVKGE